MSIRVLVTGASGFVGSALLRHLATQQLDLVVAVRSGYTLSCSERVFKVGNINAETDWSAAIRDVDVVVHVAGLAHLEQHTSTDALTAFRSVNCDGTLNLARQAVAAGVRRLIYISSIGVNGDQGGRPLTADDSPAPVDFYAQSKWEAEQALMALAKESALEVVIIRPPLVYGTGAPGNFGKLVRAVSRGIPLPLGAVKNRRTLVALENLVDLIRVCITHPDAANQVFLAGDAEDISTTELLKCVAKALSKPALLLPVPVGMMAFGAGLLGKRDRIEKICGDLQVDITKTRQVLGWNPPVSIRVALCRIGK